MVFVILLLIAAAALFGVYALAFYSREKGRAENIHDIPAGDQYQRDREKMRRLIDDMDALPCERVQITSFDGLTLSARYYHVSDSAPVHIGMHGYRGSAIRDFCGGARISMELGCNVLLVDQRGNGMSGGRTISFGVNERRDALSWMEYMRSRLGADVPMVLYGVSMGAATVLMVSGMDELPANVRGVVADCPFSSPEAIIRKVAREDMHLPAALMMPLVRLAARRIGGFDLSAASAVEAVRRAKIPALIIHGEDDRFVPCAMSREIHAANPSMVRLETFPGAGHGLSYMVDTERYERAVREFLLKIDMR